MKLLGFLSFLLLSAAFVAAEEGEFSGRKILLLGSSAGMAKEAGKFIASRGGKVVFSSRSQDKLDDLLKELGNPPNAFGITCDAYKLEEIESLVKKSAELMGGIDGFMYGPTHVDENFMVNLKSFEDGLWAKLNRDQQKMNVEHFLESFRMVVPYLRKEKHSSVVAISSIIGRTPTKLSAPYGAAKATQDAWVKSLALAYANEGIRVNGFAAGFHKTALAGSLPKPLLEEFDDRVPLGRGGTSEEGGEMLAFLLSKRSSYMTGQIVVSDGGVLLYNSFSEVSAFNPAKEMLLHTKEDCKRLQDDTCGDSTN
mmetsp:Transcript_6179/g.7071  ORF Transcript_6179/g.7071 Transcript_6179/m.7071 type:complete len:311 (-) Transcript_6179:52-984(-)